MNVLLSFVLAALALSPDPPDPASAAFAAAVDAAARDEAIARAAHAAWQAFST